MDKFKNITVNDDYINELIAYHGLKNIKGDKLPMSLIEECSKLAYASSKIIKNDEKEMRYKDAFIKKALNVFICLELLMHSFGITQEDIDKIIKEDEKHEGYRNNPLMDKEFIKRIKNIDNAIISTGNIISNAYAKIDPIQLCNCKMATHSSA